MSSCVPVKRVLMIAYLFPPVGGIGAAGAQRVLKFAKYLPCYGWEPLVLTVKEDAYEPYLALDQTLLERVPPGTKVYRTRVIRWLTRLLLWRRQFLGLFRPQHNGQATPSGHQPAGNAPVQKTWYQRLKDAMTDLFEIPDEEMGWFLPAVARGLSVISREEIAVIYSTGRPWTAHLIGVALKALTGKPLVVDFRDPWLTNQFRPQYSGLRERLEAACERTVIQQADLVIANTEELKSEFQQRFPEQPAGKFMALLNGYDPDDYPAEQPVPSEPNGKPFTVTHTGFLYGKRDPKCFLEAVKALMRRQAVDPKTIRVRLVGTVELPYDLQGYLRQSNLDRIVTLHGQVPYQQSLSYLRSTDLLLLLQPGTKTQVPSKLFDYIGMGKPILAISPKDGATSLLVAREGLGVVADPDRVEEIAGTLETIYQNWRSGVPLHAGYQRAYQKFNVKVMAHILADRLDQLTSHRAGPGSRPIG